MRGIDAGFLPVTREEMDALGWDALDFLYISGDAYVDHPSFAVSVITRVLTTAGYRVGVISQPDWQSREAFETLGCPRLGIMIGAGNLDSMVAHYTAAKNPADRICILPAVKAANALTVQRWCMQTVPEKPFPAYQLSLAVLKPACAVWHTTITGRIR